MASLNTRYSLEKNLSEFRKMLPGNTEKLTAVGIKDILSKWNFFIQPVMEARLNKAQSIQPSLVQWVQYNDERGIAKVIQIYSESIVTLEQEQIAIQVFDTDLAEVLEASLYFIKFGTQSLAKKEFERLVKLREEGQEKIIFIDN